MLPPDAASGAGSPAAGSGSPSSPSGASPASSPGAASSSPGAAAPTAAPSRDWEKDYSSLQSKYEPYEKLGLTPEQMSQTVQYAKTVYQMLQDGRLAEVKKEAEAAARAGAQPAADPFEKFDELGPREQAQALASYLRNELGGMSKAEIEAIRKENQAAQSNLAQQLQLFQTLMGMKLANPEIDPNQLVQKATELSTASPASLMELALNQMLSPKKLEVAVAAAREEEKARLQQERDKERIGLPMRPAPRILQPDKRTYAEKNAEVFDIFTKALLQNTKVA